MILKTFKYFLTRAIAGASYFICSIIIISNYSTEEYGVYSIALTSAQVTAIIFTTWVGLSANLVIPGLSEKTEAVEKIKMYSFLGFISCLVSTILLGLAYHFSVISMPSSFIIPSVFFCFAFGIHENQMSIINARGKTDAYSISTIVRYVSGLLAVWIAVNLTYYGRENALLGLAIGSLFAIALPVIWTQCTMAFSVNLVILRNSFKKTALYGASSMIVFGLWTFATYTSRISLHSDGLEAELGAFAITTDLLNGPLVLLFQAVHLAWAPAVVEAINSGNFDRFRTLSSEYLGAVVVLALPGLAAIWFLGPSLMMMLSGGHQEMATNALVGWITATTVFSSMFGAAGLILLASGKKKAVVCVTLFVLILNFIAASFIGGSALRVAQGNGLTIGFGVIILAGLLILRAKIFLNVRHLFPAAFTAVAIVSFLIFSGAPRFTQSPLEYLTYCFLIFVFCYILFDTFSCRTKLNLIYKKSVFYTR